MLVERRTFQTLDGMRGVAALLVMIRHGGSAFAPLIFPNSFLAVDLFYLLSGCVIASAYDGRLESGVLTPGQFILLRYIRLWPLYALGTVLGLIVLFSKIAHHKSAIGLSAFWSSVSVTVTMLPSVGTRDFYPASAVAWSLGLEMAINVVYALAFRWLNTRVLIVIMSVGAVGVLIAITLTAGLDQGWSWRSIWIGIVRVTFSFTAGVLMFRHRARLPTLPLPALGILVVLATLLMLNPEPVLRRYLWAFTVLAGFPLLVAAGMRHQPPRWLVPLTSLLGVTSYAIYMLHPPLIDLADWALSKAHVSIYDYGPWSGLAIMMIIVATAWGVDLLYDQPVRQWLTRHSRSAQHPRQFTAP